jgi:hypothetical protein
MGGWSKSYNAIGGQDGTDYLLAFDIRVGWGRNSYRQTVVALRSSEVRMPPLNRGGYIYREGSGWRLVIPKHSWLRAWDVLAPDTIEALWQALK